MPTAPKNPLKPPAQQQSEQAVAAAAPTASKERPYRITQQLRLDLTDPQSLVEQLGRFAGPDPENPEPVTVFAFVGTGKGINPTDALKDYGASNDMAGDYEVAADSSIKEFKGVSTEAKRTVSFS
jgi:hypothetical protein